MSSYGAIDIGTNSTRLLVARIQGGRIQSLCTAMEMTRLGEGLQATGKLQPAAVERTVAAVARFEQEIRARRVAAVDAVATSAAREASNVEDFLSRLATVAGLSARVLSGEDEARLSYQGALSGLGFGDSPLAVIDIGGGSTEIVFRGKAGAIIYKSHPVGAVRCTENKTTGSEIAAAMRSDLENLQRVEGLRLIGVGGTITALAAMEQGLINYQPEMVHGYFLGHSAVRRWLRRLSGMTLGGKKQLPGLQPHRADVITAGVTILQVILDGLAVPGITVSEADILHGIILNLAGLL